MPLVLKDRVKETTTTTGTGTITLAGAVSGYQSFSAIGNANTTYYTIVDTSTGEWEVGLGTYTAAGTTLSRDTVLESSNSGSLVNFGAGPKDVFVTYPAERAVVSGDTAYLTIPAPSTTGNVLTSNGTSWTSAAPPSTLTITNITAAYTVISSDAGKIFNCTTNTFTISLTSAATLGSGFNCTIWNTGSGNITIDPSGTQTIDGSTTLILYPGEGTQIVCTGSAWITGNKKTMEMYAENWPSGQARPTATAARAVAIGASQGGTQSRASGSGGFSVIGGNASGSNSFAAFGTASATGAVAMGANSSGSAGTAAGAGSVALGGTYATGNDSFSVSTSTNTSSYGGISTSAIGMGYLARSTAPYAVAIGYNAYATGNNSVVIGQDAVSGGFGTAGIAIGYRSYAYNVNRLFYQGNNANAGEKQFSIYTYIATTSNATPALMTSNGNTTPSNGNFMGVLFTNTAVVFTGIVIGKKISALDCAAFKFEALMTMTTSGTATLVTSSVTAISNTPGWAVTLGVNTTFNSLTITVTGAAATSIEWMASIQTTDVKA